MSSIRFGATHEFQLLRREEVRTRWTLETALPFLKRFRNDSAALAGFRRLVPSQGRGITAASTDQQLFQAIAKMMVSGELLIVKPQGLIDHGHLSLKVIAAAVREAPPAQRKEPEIVEETNTFDSDHDGVAQAAVLRAAAANADAAIREEDHALCADLSAPVRRHDVVDLEEGIILRNDNVLLVAAVGGLEHGVRRRCKEGRGRVRG